jgi:hypothetical protein
VHPFKIIAILPLAAMFLSCALSAQETAYERFRGHNAALKEIQPTWMSPLIQPDSRLGQSLRLSFSNSYTSASTRTANYGNWHTLSLPQGDRVQLNLMAPPYIQNNSPTLKDGFGDPMAEVKYRIVSGDASHGNFVVTAMLAETWPTGSYKNGAPTAVYYPTLAAGKMWGRFDVQSTLGGMMPTGKIAAQGRQIAWNTTAQVLVGERLWADLEDNATYNIGGPGNGRGKSENFVTPAAFYVVRRDKWAPTHMIFALGGGMQIATSAFHPYNHNLIPELRVLF